MIVKMRKMDLLLYHREQEKFLDELRGLGVVHITSEQPTDSAAAQELGGEVQRALRVAAALKKLQKEKNIAASSAPGDISGLVARYEECESKRDRIEQEFAALRKDRAALAPWGSFDWQSIRRLADIGVGIKFYTAPEKKFGLVDKSKAGIEVIKVQDGVVYFAVVFRGAAPEIANAEEARLPDTSIKELDEKIAALEARRAAVDVEMVTMAACAAAVQDVCVEKANQLRFEEARHSMTSAAEGKLLKLSGWVPKKDEANLAKFLQKYPAYVMFRDSTEEDNVPVKLLNRGTGFSKLVEPVLGLYSLPGYREIDVAPFVAPFFTIFFGLCLGDAGYGLIVMLASIAAMFVAGPKMRPILMLGFVLGLSTTICGILMNGFFGATIFGETGLVKGEAFAKFAVLGSSEVNGKTSFPAMSLAMLAGFIQVFLGMLIQSYVQMRERGFQAGLQPLSSILMAFGAVVMGAHTQFLNLGIENFSVGALNIGQGLLMAIPFAAGKYMLIGGVLLLLLFNGADRKDTLKKIIMRPLAGLWALYNFITGFLSNILSYLRLFALGLAGGLLGGAVNKIAFMLSDGIGGGVGIAAMVVILVGGHALNLALSAMGSFVHPLRLTFVEFYGAVGFQGGSQPYAPFAKVEK